jgi:predicted dehydrogenase
MRALVVGYGSIGSRHVRILGELGYEVAVVSARDVEGKPHFDSIVEAVQEFAPDYAVIATETARHIAGITELAGVGFRGTLLVEKPLFHTICETPLTAFRGSYVAYNLRFHPLFQRLYEIISHEKILSVQAYVGQYLPFWRPERDYRDVYSADKNAGGGVLRDLSHELDLLNWLLGGWRKLTALGGHFSHLEINSDDVFSIIMETLRCPVVTLEMNYLDRLGRRRMIVNTECLTIELDLVAGHLLIDGEREIFQVERDQSYREMHSAMLGGNSKMGCTFSEGFEVLKMIDAAERAVFEHCWVINEDIINKSLLLRANNETH